MEFRHIPFDRKIDQVRLLRVRPLPKRQPRTKWPSIRVKSDHDDESVMIDCALVHVDFHLTSEHEFNALSYTWGPSNALRTIRINGRQFDISENLWQFLYVAAQTHSICNTWLWIDQICIHQSSISERNHQVGLMREIYQQASSVLIWLGPAGENSDLALKMIANGKVLAKVGVRSNWYDDNSGSPRIAEAPFWQPVLSLIQRPYFYRLWIVQEVLQAKSLKILCGWMTLPWDIFSQTIDKIYDGAAGRGFRLVQGITSADPVKALREERDSKRKEYGGPSVQDDASNSRLVQYHASNSRLSQLICSFRQNQSTDPRDRVFGLLGLVGPDERVEIDYRISPLRLYIDVIMKLTPPGVDPYDHIFFRDSFPGSFAKTLYRALIDPSYGIDRQRFSHRADGCRSLCDAVRGQVGLRAFLQWKDEQGWIEPSNNENFSFFGENFEADAMFPEFTCNTVRHMLQYMFSWLPGRDEIVAWWTKDEGWDKNQNIGQLVMKRSPSVHGEWRFTDNVKGRFITYRPGVKPGTLDSVEASAPEWFQRADAGRRGKY